MNTVTVAETVRNGLCTSCGVCKGICPKNCISWEYGNGMFVPKIDENACVKCGQCASVCAGLGHSYEQVNNDAVATITGQVRECWNAWSRNADLRHKAASGGVVSTLVQTLLNNGSYDCVFCVDSYDYRQQLMVQRYTAETFDKLENTPKSRYLPVSQEHAVSYIKNHKTEKVIIIGTPCALRGIDAVLKKLRRNREQYLLIGLFCDKVFNYNVLPYWEDTLCEGKTIVNLHFKNKDSGGWPGNMKFFLEEGQPFFVSKDERQKAKEWFMPERCMYCVDKLNVVADISLGDNYTEEYGSKLGSNSVIIRTQQGYDAWVLASPQLESFSIDIAAIQKAQDLNWRLNNLYFGDLKARRLKNKRNLNTNIPRTENYTIFDQLWYESLIRIKAGQAYAQKPEKLKKQIQKREPGRLSKFVKRGYYFIKRRVYK